MMHDPSNPKWVYAHKSTLSRMVKTSVAERVAWFLLQWWECPELDIYLSEQEKMNVNAVSNHVRAVVRKLPATRRCELRRAMWDMAFVGKLFWSGMKQMEREKIARTIMGVFGII